jgi:hypothetical protein
MSVGSQGAPPLFEAFLRVLTAGPMFDYLIDQAELPRFGGRQEFVTLERGLDRFEWLAGMLHVDLVEPRPQGEDLARLDLDVGGLSLRPARGLMDHDP